MQIISCNIFGFGSICNETIDFQENLTSIIEENGYGKSTLAAFIKAMFYGMKTANANAVGLKPRTKYYPWNSTSFGGELVFSVDLKKYKIIRTFSKASQTSDTFELIDLESGLPSTNYSQNIGEELFGIDEEGFERSTFSDGKASLEALPGTLRGKIGNPEDADLGEYEKAKKTLSEASKMLKNARKGGKINELSQEIDELEREIQPLKNEISEYLRLTAQIKELNQRKNEENAVLSLLDEKFKASALLEANKEKLAKYNDILQRIENKRKDAAAIEQKYNGTIPTEEQIKKLQDKINEYKTQKNRLDYETEKLNGDDYKKLCTIFSQNKPSDNEFFTISQEIELITKANISLSRENEELASCLEEYKSLNLNTTSLPTKEQISETKNLVAFPSQKKKSRGEVALLILSAIGILGGIAASFVNAMIGIALCVVFAVVLSFVIFYGIFNSKMAQGTQTADATRRKEFLKKFGFSEDADFDLAAQKLYRAIELKDREKNLLEKIESIKTELAASLKKAWEFTDRFIERRDNAKKTFEELQILFNRYINEVQKSEQNKTFLEAELIQKQKEISDIISASPELFEIKLDEIKSDLENHQRIISELSELEKIANEIRENDKIEEIIIPENPENSQEIDEQRKIVNQNIRELEGEALELSKQADKFKDSQEKLNEKTEQIREKTAEREDMAAQKQLLDMALEFLENAKETMAERYSQKITEGFEKYSDMFFQSENNEISVDSDLNVSVKKDSVARKPKNFSDGQQCIMDICLRLSLIDAIFENQKPFVILDDPFTTLDSQNLEKAKNLVRNIAKEKQVIYFTCHPSREIKEQKC